MSFPHGGFLGAVAIALLGGASCSSSEPSSDQAPKGPSTPVVPSAPTTAPLWPMQAADGANSNRSTLRAASEPVVRWQHGFGALAEDPIHFVVDGDGRIFASSNTAVHLLSKDGDELWSRPFAKAGDIAWPSGNLLLVATDKLYALDVQGMEQWSSECDPDPRYAPGRPHPSDLNSDFAGNIYFICHLSLQSVTPSGEPRWSSKLVDDSENLGTRPFSYQDTLLVASLRSAISISPADGTVRWRTAVSAGASVSPSGALVPLGPSAAPDLWWLNGEGTRARFAPDGTLRESTTDKAVFGKIGRLANGVVASTGTGAQTWDAAGVAGWQANVGLVQALVVDADDTVIVATKQKHVVALKDGARVWDVALDTAYDLESLAIGADGDVLVGTTTSELFCLSAPRRLDR